MQISKFKGILQDGFRGVEFFHGRSTVVQEPIRKRLLHNLCKVPIKKRSRNARYFQSKIDSINLTKLRDPILFVFSASQATYERIFFGCARIPPAKMLSIPITHSVTSTGDDWETVVINSQTDER